MPISNRRIKRVVAVLLLAGLGVSQQTLAADETAQTRFSGAASLATPKPTSSDGRFQLNAALSASPQTSGDARFSLSAKLRPDPKSVADTCAPLGNSLFRDGFE